MWDVKSVLADRALPVLLMVIILLLLWCSKILGLSSCFQLDGAPVSASTAACVGTCLYGAFGTSSELICCDNFCLCSLAAFLDSFSFENIDILPGAQLAVLRKGDRDEDGFPGVIKEERGGEHDRWQGV